MAGNKDLNHLKVVLVEKKKRNPVSGYPDSWDVHQRPYRNGVLIRRNLRWRC